MQNFRNLDVWSKAHTITWTSTGDEINFRGMSDSD